ncbi:hypothetical protein WME79_18410 [Sorangium sp. So ce726]|uniref:hypothetical protein n=1 Tax=Sorangium sp. So ce726 TaxID=3133319 RepID=UPI003F5D9618
MSLFSKRVLPLTLLGAAAVLGGCVGDASLEGDGEQATQPDVAAADPESADAIDPDAAEAVGTTQQAAKANWTCKVHDDDWNSGWGPKIAGYVTIWWGYQQSDATWACNAWRSACGGQCWAE